MPTVDAEATLSGAAGLGSMLVIDRDIYRSLVLSDNPVAYWRMDSGTLFDSSGNGLHATRNGTTITAGAIRNTSSTATTFNGTTDSVSIPLTPLLGLHTFTIEMWLKTTSSGNGTLFAAQEPFNNGFRFLLSAGFLSLAVVTTSGQYTISNPTLVNDGRWHYVACDFAQSVASVVVDATTTTNTFPAGTISYGADPIVRYLGRNVAGTAYLNGSLDEVAVYPYILGEAKRLQRYRRVVYQSGWSVAPSLPIPLHYHPVTGDGNNAHVLGGYSTSVRSDHRFFNAALNTWSTKAAVPNSDYHGTAVYVTAAHTGLGTDAIYLAYGWAATWFYRYNVGGNNWTYLTTLPASAGGSHMVAIDHVLWLIIPGGYVHTYSLSASENPSAQWQTNRSLVPSALAISSLRAAVHGGRIYVHAGTTLYEFNPNTLIWTQKASSPYFIAHNFVSFKGKIWAFGGVNSGGTAQNIVYSYDPTSNQWTDEGTALNTLAYTNATPVAGGLKLLSPGGWNGFTGVSAASEFFTAPATSGAAAMTTSANLLPYPLGRVNFAVELDLDAEGEMVGGVRGLTPGPIRTHQRGPDWLPYGAAVGVGALTGRFPENWPLAGQAGGVSGLTEVAV